MLNINKNQIHYSLDRPMSSGIIYEHGGGLRLVVSPRGSKKGVMRFTIDGKRREMGLSSYPDLGLGEAL